MLFIKPINETPPKEHYCADYSAIVARVDNILRVFYLPNEIRQANLIIVDMDTNKAYIIDPIHYDTYTIEYFIREYYNTEDFKIIKCFNRSQDFQFIFEAL